MGTGISAERIAEGGAWEEFCDALRAAGAVLRRPGSPADALDRAEGCRYLSRLTRLALERFVEYADPTAPAFYRLSHETAKIGCDNPDSLYLNATIDGRYEYRLRGTRGTVPYLGFGTYYGHYGSKARSGCSGYLEATQLLLGADGSFEIVLSCDHQPGNWLPMEPDTSMLIVRQNFLDRERERPAELTIERRGAAGPPEPLSSTALATGLSEAARFVAGTATLFAEWAEGFARRPNELGPMDPAVTGGAHGDPNIHFHMGYWQLAADEALLVEARPPECEFWNFQLNNHWMESLDYRYRRIHYNKRSTVYRPDGSFRLVVAHTDPGVPNWVDTAGHSRGTMGLRWIKAAAHPRPRTRVVKHQDVPAIPVLTQD
ncbi:MAG TPA: hypothetical protein DEP35_14740 [Deltaproteobacteria bacterium]|jgi:hypothetical protein|nr:hypothetical protein [Deltaproteobacteria bacterium]